MKTEMTELVFILDKSGSMGGLERDTISGFNAMLEKQHAVEGACRVTTVLFDTDFVLLHDGLDIGAVRPITEKDYCVGGSTALLDAIGDTVYRIENRQMNNVENRRADKVMFVIITDGEENSSREYSAQDIRQIIENRKQRGGWEFIFLGANIDAIGTAARLGIDRKRAQNFVADSEGVQENFNAIHLAACRLRETGAISDEWKESIEKNYKKPRQKGETTDTLTIRVKK
ncbi:MAG: VWA domain-containing protein [Thermotogaceae bacterium]|nr:VWA domain-containing protein [Thermotogaceae bacterium]